MCADGQGDAAASLGELLGELRAGGGGSHDHHSAGREPPQRPGRQLRGQTAGIVGYGSIGSYLAELLVAIGMDVVVHDPFVPELQRARLIAALESVDYVFLFSERRNARNIELLTPNLYIKAFSVEVQGTTVSYTATICNNGEGASAKFYIGAYAHYADGSADGSTAQEMREA